MILSEQYKKRLNELAGITLVESISIKDELNSLTFKNDVEKFGGKIYAVGGRVRDEFLGKESKDLDILITGVPLDELANILSKYGKVKDVGKSFGIIKFVPFGQIDDIDIAIPRKEKPNGIGGYQGFDVQSDHTLPIEQELLRRDATVNSIAQDAEGNIVDPFGGLEDIKNKVLRATNPHTFEDDSLRMLRFVQFSSRFGFTIEPNTLAMIKRNAHRIKEISPERFLIEFDKIVKKGNPQIGMDILIETGLFKEMFGFDYAGDKDFNNVKTMSDLIFKLFENSNISPSIYFKEKLNGDIETTNQLKALELQDKLNNDILHDRYTVQNIFKLFPNPEISGLLNNHTKDIINTFQSGKYPASIKQLEINGNDLISLGYKDVNIGKILNLVMKNILSDTLRNDKNEILRFVETLK
jgi:tRNA nucleotidyltransferase/poly(A) polymerase